MSEGGWDLDKVLVFREQFLSFLNHVTVNSKEQGPIVLGEHVYRAQHRFLDTLFRGLADDKHDFKVLKSRQLGLSTISRALTLFWTGVHSGLRGYMVYDTDAHKEEARLEILSMIQSLPPELEFPKIERQNRYLMELSNNSLINFAAAGVRSGKGSGTLGRSSGINYVHASELCSWENVEGLESFKNALAEDFPNRLYIWESTARGFNLWNEMWNEAKADSAHQVTTFLGWWAKDSQMIPREHPDFMRYGEEPPSEKELKKIKAVKVQYGWDITPEQLAWIRRKMDPTAEAEGDAPVEYEGDALRIQENPWTEEEAFQMTGATFFQPDDLTEIANKTASKKYSAYSYVCGMDFRDSRIVKAYNTRSIELKVWEDPVPEGVYIVAADVAFGSDEKNDRSACQVLRCYADEVEQVAEYAWPLVTSRQYAWVLLSLLGFYGKQPGAQVHFILEINGPGEATWNEIQNVKQIVQSGMYKVDLEDRGLLDMFKNVRNYFYTRSDSMSPGQSWQFKTSSQLKVAIMERLRDFVTNKRLTIRSLETLEEMKAITRDGDSIRAQGTKKDDRAIALALGVRCWEERVRRGMMAGKRTRANEEAKRRLTLKDQISIFNESQLSSFFAVKAGQRRRAAQAAAQAKWRSRR